MEFFFDGGRCCVFFFLGRVGLGWVEKVMFVYSKGRYM